MRRPLQSGADGVGVDGSANARANSTAPWALRNPAPSVSGSHCGYACAVNCRIALMAFGDRPGFACNINATVPLITGADMLVPLRLKYGRKGVTTVPVSKYDDIE